MKKGEQQNYWEKEFDDEFVSGFHWRNIEGQDTKVRIKSFIRQLLQSQRKEVEEECLEAVRCKKHEDQSCGGCSDCSTYQILLQALKDK